MVKMTCVRSEDPSKLGSIVVKTSLIPLVSKKSSILVVVEIYTGFQLATSSSGQSGAPKGMSGIPISARDKSFTCALGNKPFMFQVATRRYDIIYSL